MQVSVVAALALVIIFAATASAIPCGSFVNEKTGVRLEFNMDGTAREWDKDGLLRSLLHHVRTGSTINVRNSENGTAESYRVSSDSKKLTLINTTWGDEIFVSQHPYQCTSLPGLHYLADPVCEYGKESVCCAAGDPRACVQDASGKGDIAKLKRLCTVRPDACLALIENYEKVANPATVFLNMYGEKKPLLEEQLQELVASCERYQSPELCQKTLEQLWRANLFIPARDLLGTMCSAKLGEYSCARFRQLSAIRLPNAPEAATALPCGEYRGTVSSLAGDLTFGDRGIVQLGQENRLRARLENGLVRIRHDKGGDFTFARIGENLLLGLDNWNQLEVFRRVAAPEKNCQAAVVFSEQPLSSGCGLDRDPRQCCREGDSQGCNRLGTMAALHNNWKEAAELYAKVCRMGVRIGCENWVYTVSKTGDAEGVEQGLSQLCKSNSSHVACDLLELNRIPQMLLTFGLEQTMENIETSDK